MKQTELIVILLNTLIGVRACIVKAHRTMEMEMGFSQSKIDFLHALKLIDDCIKKIDHDLEDVQMVLDGLNKQNSRNYHS